MRHLAVEEDDIAAVGEDVLGLKSPCTRAFSDDWRMPSIACRIAAREAGSVPRPAGSKGGCAVPRRTADWRNAPLCPAAGSSGRASGREVRRREQRSRGRSGRRAGRASSCAGAGRPAPCRIGAFPRSIHRTFGAAPSPRSPAIVFKRLDFDERAGRVGGPIGLDLELRQRLLDDHLAGDRIDDADVARDAAADTRSAIAGALQGKCGARHAAPARLPPCSAGEVPAAIPATGTLRAG